MKPLFAVASAVVTAFITVHAQSDPKTAADALLAADRAFASAAAKADIVPALSAMFADEVVLTHAGGIAYGSAQAIEALKASPLNAAGRLEWAPARVSVSGDGQHGFTAGFMTLNKPDGSAQPLKYLAYWEKQAKGWRVLAYKRSVAKVAAPSAEVSYVLPNQTTTGASDASMVDTYRTSLAEAERSFARDAQTMGIGAAFKHYGRADAINLGGPDTPGFLVGNEQIGAAIGGNTPPNTSPVNWGPEKAIVAASGDFGVTIGYIVPNKPGPDGKTPKGQPFFTIWKRDSLTAPWRYVAE